MPEYRPELVAVFEWDVVHKTLTLRGVYRYPTGREFKPISPAGESTFFYIAFEHIGEDLDAAVWCIDPGMQKDLREQARKNAGVPEEDDDANS